MDSSSIPRGFPVRKFSDVPWLARVAYLGPALHAPLALLLLLLHFGAPALKSWSFCTAYRGAEAVYLGPWGWCAADGCTPARVGYAAGAALGQAPGPIDGLTRVHALLPVLLILALAVLGLDVASALARNRTRRIFHARRVALAALSILTALLASIYTGVVWAWVAAVPSPSSKGALYWLLLPVLALAWLAPAACCYVHAFGLRRVAYLAAAAAGEHPTFTPPLARLRAVDDDDWDAYLAWRACRRWAAKAAAHRAVFEERIRPDIVPAPRGELTRSVSW